jgi:hypothetical protein
VPWHHRPGEVSLRGRDCPLYCLRRAVTRALAGLLAAAPSHRHPQVNAKCDGLARYRPRCPRADLAGRDNQEWPAAGSATAARVCDDSPALTITISDGSVTRPAAPACKYPDRLVRQSAHRQRPRHQGRSQKSAARSRQCQGLRQLVFRLPPRPEPLRPRVGR